MKKKIKAFFKPRINDKYTELEILSFLSNYSITIDHADFFIIKYQKVPIKKNQKTHSSNDQDSIWMQNKSKNYVDG